MANRRPAAAPARRHRTHWGRWVLLAAVVLGGVLWLYRGAIAGYAAAGTAYGARVACSCVYQGGRSLEDCAKDKVAGMELIRLSQDPAARSVTATFPLVRSDTARFQDGPGCVLDRWAG